jgi:carboxyl-terminal processing protease
VRSTTATSLIVAFLAAAPAAAGDRVDSLIETAARFSEAGRALDPVALRASCGADALCVARAVVASVPNATLVPVDHPDTDSIRWVRNEASVAEARAEEDGRLYLRLAGFGRKAAFELAEAVASHGAAGTIVLDLRGQGGGSLDRMLEVAALFAGPHKDALRLDGPEGRVFLDLPEPVAALHPADLTVLVDGGTASSAEMLAALLRVHARARILGTRTRGKDWLNRLIPIDHDWRLNLPAERVTVPGTEIAGGLRPDAGLAAAGW